MANGLSDKQIEEFKEAFKIFEKDETGVISVEAVPILLRVIGQSLSNEEIAVLAEQIDANESGSVDFPEFLSYVSKKQINDVENPNELLEALDFFNKTGSNYLHKDVLENVIYNLGERLTPSETEEFIQSIPYDEDGNVTYDDLLAVIYNREK